MTISDFNLPPRLRLVIYIFNGIGSIIVIYLSEKALIGQAELNAWAAYTVFSSALASINVPPKGKI